MMVDERAEVRENKDRKHPDELCEAVKAAGCITEDAKQGQKGRKNV